MVRIKHLVKKVLHVLAPSSSPLFSCRPQSHLFICGDFASGFCGFLVFYLLLPSEILAFCKNSQLAVIQANHLITLVFVCYPCTHIFLLNFSVRIYVLSSLAHLPHNQSLQLL